MKVAFYLDEAIIEYNPHLDAKEYNRIVNSLCEKIDYVEFDLPYYPQKGMEVDLADYEELFGLTREEILWLSDEPYLYVKNLRMQPERVIVILTKEESDN